MSTEEEAPAQVKQENVENAENENEVENEAETETENGVESTNAEGHENGAAAAAPASAAEDPADADAKSKRVHPSGKTMIVRNLPASMLFTYEEELRNLFGKYGQIAYIKRGGVPVYHDTVDPTLSAYVNFENSESSEAALAERGTILGGNPIEIDILRAGEHTVVISSLPYVIAKECLYKLLSPCGPIKDIVKIPARPTAFIEFENEEGAVKALSLSGSLLINNMAVVLQRRGALDNPPKKAKKNVPPHKRGNIIGPKRGGRGGMGRGGNRNQGMGVYQSWDGPPMGFRGPRGNYSGNGGGISYNNWGNGNFRDNNIDERPYKRRKQNDWYQY